MKSYTLRAALHDTRVFYGLILEHRRAKKNRRKEASSDWLARYLTGVSRRARA